MRKRISAALLCACLTFSLAIPALAAPASVPLDEASQAVSALGIMVGDENGNMNLSRRVTRAEFVTMAVKATPGGKQIGQSATSPYPDVPRTHWASGYVEAAVSWGLVSGYSDGTFRPGKEISLAEGASIALQILGYGPSDFSGAYPTGQLAMYHSLRLDRGVSVSAPSEPLTRQDAMYLFYNLLSAKNKDGVPYINTLGYSLNDAGQVDLLSLVNGEMDGPVVAQGNWYSSLPVDPSQSKVYRNGALATAAAIQNYDVVYWNRAMGTIWVYSNKATGTIQALEPSGSNPSAVTVAGRTYSIETSAAAYALSDLGEYHQGDTVTLLLGRDGGVAAVATAAASAGERVGLVTAVSNGTYPDGNGGTYSAQTVTLLATDGQSYQYQSRSTGMKEGSLARVTVSDQGEVSLRSLSSSSLSGKVNAAGTKLGSYPFADGVEILDVSGEYGVRVYPSRLAGLNLSSSQVRYYSLNSRGEVDQLILNDVTGDMYGYGVLTKLEEASSGEFAAYSYEFDLGGTAGAIVQTTTEFPVEPGPIQVVGDPAQPERLRALTATKTGKISEGQFVAGNQKYTLSQSVAVYEYRSGQYYLSSLARAEAGDFTLTAWYDKPESSGGRIRVIVAREQ